MARVFIGFDERQAVAYNVCRFSIERRASVPVAVTPLKLDALPIKREGLTRFTFSRFLVPWLCDYQGMALFLDSDFLVLGDVAELFDRTEDKAVWLSKNPLRYEWASLMLFDCAHPRNRALTPEFVETASDLHGIAWLPGDLIGDLPREWNHLVGYDPPRPDAKGLHFTQGLPIFPETEGSPYRDEWFAEHRAMNASAPWLDVMGRSVHVARTADGGLVAKLHPDAAA